MQFRYQKFWHIRPSFAESSQLFLLNKLSHLANFVKRINISMAIDVKHIEDVFE